MNRKGSLHFLQITGIIILTLSASNLFGQLKTFNHSINSGWNESPNWTPMGLPTSNDSVIIPSGLVNIPAGFSAIARYVRVETGAELVIESIVNYIGKLTIDDVNGVAIKNEGSITNWGELEINDCLIGISNSGRLENQQTGIITIDSTSSHSITNNDSIFNYGDMEMRYVLSSDWVSLKNEGYIYNGAHILIDSVGHGALRSNSSNAHFINADTLEIRAYNLLSSGQFNEGIEVINGLFINQNTGAVFITNPIAGSNAIWIDRAVMENYGIIDVRHIAGNGIFISSDAVLRNENIIKLDDLSFKGLNIMTTGTFFQSPAGVMRIQNIVGDPLTIEESTVVEIEGIFDIH